MKSQWHNGFGLNGHVVLNLCACIGRINGLLRVDFLTEPVD